MKGKELKHLNRRELLEILLEQSRLLDKQRQEIAMLEEKLQSRELRVGNAGSLAEVAAELSGLFEAAQKTAELYLDNIKSRNS